MRAYLSVHLHGRAGEWILGSEPFAPTLREDTGSAEQRICMGRRAGLGVNMIDTSALRPVAPGGPCSAFGRMQFKLRTLRRDGVQLSTIPHTGRGVVYIFRPDIDHHGPMCIHTPIIGGAV